MPISIMTGMETFDEHDYAIARGFQNADEAYLDIWHKSMEAQEQDALMEAITRGIQEEPHRANSQSE